VYVAMTYTCIIPFLKGIYLTLNSWRGNQNKEGWKETNRRKREDKRLQVPTECKNPPEWVSLVARLKLDM
jgi:hypothetical protein